MGQAQVFSHSIRLLSIVTASKKNIRINFSDKLLFDYFISYPDIDEIQNFWFKRFRSTYTKLSVLYSHAVSRKRYCSNKKIFTPSSYIYIPCLLSNKDPVKKWKAAKNKLHMTLSYPQMQKIPKITHDISISKKHLLVSLSLGWSKFWKSTR